MQYKKIDTLYHRDDAFKVDVDRIRLPEFELPQRWLVTEKIDGTSVRIYVDVAGDFEHVEGVGVLSHPGEVDFHGRTNKAQLPDFLASRLKEMFPVEKFEKVFGRGFDPLTSAILYGEGYGARINKGGNYRPQGVNFRLFDVVVFGQSGRPWWLNWENVEDVAGWLDIQTVPVLLRDATLAEAVDAVLTPSVVAYEDSHQVFVQEGVVARTEPLLFGRDGRRIMWKLKNKDFARHD